MAKYDSLREHLGLNGGDRITLSFGQIDEIVPGGLPRSAYDYQAYWANERNPHQPWKQGGLLPDTR